MAERRTLIRLLSLLVPRSERRDWVEEWEAELTAAGGTGHEALGAFADAWYLRTEGWTMSGVWRDVRVAVRGLARKPMFTALAGLTLALGIGANTAIFSVVDGVLLDPLPFPDAGEIVSVNHTAPGMGLDLVPHSEDTYLHYQERVRSLDAFAVYQRGEATLLLDTEPLRVAAARVTADFFEVTAVQPVLGRTFTAGEDRTGAEPVVVLSDALWRQSFGADGSVVGDVVRIGGVGRRVVGVMPPGFDFPREGTQVWLPQSIDPADPDQGSYGLVGVGRMADGATAASVAREMDDLLGRYAEANADLFPATAMQQGGMRSSVDGWKETQVADVRQALWVVLGTVGFVLLIACANVANLFLVRAEARQREQAVRTAMGASWSDMVRLYLAESVTLSVAGGALGLLLASFGVQALLRMAPVNVPRASTIDLDGSVLLFTAAISVVSGILFGLFPLMGYGRGDLTTTLRDGGRGRISGKKGQGLRNALVVGQVAMAMVLLVGSGLMVRSFSALRTVDPGFETEGRLTFRVALPEADYPDVGTTRTFYRSVEDRLGGIPGVEAVTLASHLPLGGTRSAGPIEPEDRPTGPDELAPIIDRSLVGVDYFRTLDIPVLEGRPLGPEDGADQQRGAVISEALAQRFWPGENAVGRMLRIPGESGALWQVVGVVADVRAEALDEEPTGFLYFPLVADGAQGPVPARVVDVTLQVGGQPLAMVPAVREAMRAVDPRLALVDIRPMTDLVDDAMSEASFTAVLLGIAAAIALLLGTVGIYGVISYMVSRRVQEIGVRMALGAPAASVRRGVVRQGMALAGVGLGLGLAGAWALSRVLSSLLYGVSATDPLTYLATTLALAGVAAAAAWIPAHRASRIDPVRALKAD